MPIFIPASDLPEVHLLSPADGAKDGSYTTYDVTKNPAVAHKIALQWLAAERAMRKRASDEEAERLRAEAAAKADAATEEAAVIEEAKEIRLAFYDDECGGWDSLADYSKERWLRSARESLQRHGKLDHHE